MTNVLPFRPVQRTKPEAVRACVECRFHDIPYCRVKGAQYPAVMRGSEFSCGPSGRYWRPRQGMVQRLWAWLVGVPDA